MNYLVIKCGGSVFEKLTPAFFENIVAIQASGKWSPVIVHGGGPVISQMLKKLSIRTVFHNGLRVTTREVLDVAEMVLNGTINKQLVSDLYIAGGKAVGLSGIDGQLITARQLDPSGRLGFVGEVAAVQPDVIEQLCKQGYIPVISPISMDEEGRHYNINGDTAAAAIAAALDGKLCFVSDVPGIWIEKDGEKVILEQISDRQISDLMKNDVISGGMVPKVKAAVDSLKQDVSEVVILNGLTPNCLLDYANGANVGTKIFLDEEEVTHA